MSDDLNIYVIFKCNNEEKKIKQINTLNSVEIEEIYQSSFRNISYVGNLNIRNKKFHGKGYILKNGRLFYECYFKNGKKHGESIEYDVNEGVIKSKGTYENDKKVGYHESFFPDGSMYRCGDYKNGKLNGYGYEYSFKQNSHYLLYKGFFVNDQFEGEGQKYYTNGNLLYKGEYKKDKENGFGEAYIFNQITNRHELYYRGYYRSGNANGFGELFEGPIVIYKGSFRNGEPFGKGDMYNPVTGLLEYTGEIRKSEKHGNGKDYVYNNQNHIQMIYTGSFKNGKRHGSGIKIYYYGNHIPTYKIVGEFERDILKKGKQFVFSSDTNRYVLLYDGEFKKNLKMNHVVRDGEGMLYDDEKGVIFIGTFRRNVQEGHCTEISLLDGSILYEGEYKSGSRHGKGILFDENNDSEEVEYINGYRKEDYYIKFTHIMNMIIETNRKDTRALYKFNKSYFQKYLKEVKIRVEDTESKRKMFHKIKNFKKVKGNILKKRLVNTKTQDLKRYLNDSLHIFPKKYSRKQKLIDYIEEIEKEKENENENEYEVDLFGNNIVNRCKGNDGCIYDETSMLYLFHQDEESGRYTNISYRNDEPQFPIMTNGKRLSEYTLCND